MYTWMRKALDKNKDDKGFTLIELLVVIIIIGILAAIAIPIFLNQRKKAVDASIKSDLRSIATQMETFFTDSQVYPDSTNYVYTAAVPGTSPGTIVLGTGTNAETVILTDVNVPAVYLNAPTTSPTTAAAATALCIVVTNTNKATRPYVWQSDLGGLQPTATACGTGPTWAAVT